MVALRKESVDRNAEKMKVGGIDVSSLSARRAWIEIMEDLEPSTTRRSLSARRAWIEIDPVTDKAWALESLSARRAWIEIICLCRYAGHIYVALRKESVDRNKMSQIAGMYEVGRSPQGERG